MQRPKCTAMEPLRDKEEVAARLTAALRAVAERQDRAAFAPVFAFYAPRAKAYFRELGADDGRAERLAEEAMLAVWRRAGVFARGDVEIGSWIFAQVRDTGVAGLQAHARPDFDSDDPALVEEPYKPAIDGQEPGARPAVGLLRGSQDPPPDEEIMLLRTLYQFPTAGAARAAPRAAETGARRLRFVIDRLRGLLGGVR